MQPTDTIPGFERDARTEVIIERNGKVRQAGTLHGPDNDKAATTLGAFKRLCNQSLYHFAKSVMGGNYFTPELHLGECNWLQRVPARRKLWLMPRNTYKSTTMRALAAHIIVQPKEANIYFPGCQDKMCRHARLETGIDCTDPTHQLDGCDVRVLLGRETAPHAKAGISWLEGQWITNELLRALWPERVWPKGGEPKGGWNQEQMTIPRTQERVEPTVFGIGVGGAATGWHFNAHLFDDLATENAANSPAVMASTIQSFRNWRSLMDDQQYSLEWSAGTIWAVGDLWSTIMSDWDGQGHGDPTVECRVRSIVEDGRIILPEAFTWDNVLQLQAADPVQFALMYMNSLADPSIADFNMAEVREFWWEGAEVCFASDERDALLEAAYGRTSAPRKDPAADRPIALNDYLRSGVRDEYLRLKYQ